MDVSAVRAAYTMLNVLFVLLGVTFLAQGSLGLPLRSDEQEPLLSLLSGKQTPDIYDRILENYLKSYDTRDVPYNGEYQVPDKRIKQGWNIAYGKRRSNKWSIAYGKRDQDSPLESQGIFSDDVQPMFKSYPQMTKRQQGDVRP